MNAPLRNDSASDLFWSGYQPVIGDLEVLAAQGVPEDVAIHYCVTTARKVAKSETAAKTSVPTNQDR